MYTRTKLVTTVVWFLWMLLLRKFNVVVFKLGTRQGRYHIVCLLVYDWKCYFHLLDRFCMGTHTPVQKNVSQDTRHCNHYLFTMYIVDSSSGHCRTRYETTPKNYRLHVFNRFAIVCIVLVLPELYPIRPTSG